jgi:hypothetical protein
VPLLHNQLLFGATTASQAMFSVSQTFTIQLCVKNERKYGYRKCDLRTGTLESDTGWDLVNNSVPHPKPSLIHIHPSLKIHKYVPGTLCPERGII